MLDTAFVSACTAALAVVGFYMGAMLHGPTALALLPTLAGAAGGFGIGWAAGRPSTSGGDGGPPRTDR